MPSCEYPGHPIVIAYHILQTFPSLSEAMIMKDDCPAALFDIRIPGEGGNVWAALHFFYHLKNQVSFRAAAAVANDYWSKTASSKETLKLGQQQADDVKNKIVEFLCVDRQWLTRK